MRLEYGGEEKVSIVEDREVRHCNWIRFLKTSDVINDVNLVGMKMKNEVVFQTIKTILPNEEIVAGPGPHDHFLVENILKMKTEHVHMTPDMNKGKLSYTQE